GRLAPGPRRRRPTRRMEHRRSNHGRWKPVPPRREPARRLGFRALFPVRLGRRGGRRRPSTRPAVLRRRHGRRRQGAQEQIRGGPVTWLFHNLSYVGELTWLHLVQSVLPVIVGTVVSIPVARFAAVRRSR